MSTAGNDWMDVTVHDVTHVGRDTILVRFHSEAAPLPRYAPGAHVAVECGGAMVRHYSLCGDVAEPGVYEVGVKLAPDTRGGSRWMFDNARPGQRMRISAPRNHFPLVEDAPAYLFLGGGIGVTPIIAMLQALRARGVRARLVHMCRSAGELAFADRLRDLGAFHDVHLHFDEEGGGIYDVQAELDRFHSDTAVYCCGPSGLMSAVQSYGERTGRAANFHFEFFAAPAEMPAAAAGEDDEFVVIQHSTGRHIPVPKTKTMLAALRDAGIEMKSECEYGVCGWCSVGVVDGRPKHFDSYLTAAEKEGNKLVLPCVSRCEGEVLTLDI